MLVFRYNTIGSTNRCAMALAAHNPGKRMLVTATAQTAGRGRAGRAWQSPIGGAWFSVILPQTRSQEHLQALPLVVGLAVHDTLCELLPQRLQQELQIKWPNDLLLENRKIAGILCEQHFGPTPTVVVGVGINANLQPTADLDANHLRQPATSLLEHLGYAINLHALIDPCAQRIVTRFDHLAQHGLDPDTQAQLDDRLAWRGQLVQAQHAGRPIVGRLAGIDPIGQLILDTDAGPQTCGSGEIQSLTPTTLTPAVLTP